MKKTISNEDIKNAINKIKVYRRMIDWLIGNKWSLHKTKDTLITFDLTLESALWSLWDEETINHMKTYDLVEQK